MAETLTVQITAHDGVTKVFRAISNGADDVGKSVEDAGKRGKRGMDELGKSAEQNADRMERLEAEATAIGAALGALGSGMILVGRLARDQRLQIEAIERAYGDAAETILDFAEYSQDALNISNDAAREGALTMETLVSNYDLSIGQIEQLLTRAADLSALRGRSFQEVSQMIQNALRGEGEYIEAIGITLNDQYVAAEAARRGIEGWTTSMTDAEKAAFRFTLFMEQSDYAIGTAAAEAERAGGSFRRLLNEMQDGAQAAGAFLGPVGEIAAEMAPIAIALPVVSAGLGRMATAARGSRTAMAALNFAINPVTLGITALVAGGALLYKEFTEVGEATRNLDDSLQGLEATLEDIRLSGETATSARLETTLAEIESIQSIIEASNLEEMNRLLGTSFESALDFDTAAVKDDLQRVVDLSDDTVNQITANLAGLTTEQRNIYLDWVNNLLETAETTAEDSNLDDILNQILITPASEVPGVMDAASASIDGLGDSVAGLDRVIRAATGGLNDMTLAQQSAAAATEGTIATIGLLADGINAIPPAAEKVGASITGMVPATAQAGLDTLALALENVQQLIDVAGFGDPLSSWNLSGHATDASLLADALTDAAASLDTVYRVIVGNTDAIANQVDGIHTWAEELINVEGQYGKIDDLIAAGRINQAEYNAAQTAYNDIAAANVAIQEDVLTIQAKQAPLIAEHTAALQQQMGVIADMPAQQQMVALAWMDSATAAKAMEINTLAAAVAAGELGANGDQAFASMVTGAAMADPALKAVLLDMGLISEGADGTITVHIPADTVSDMDRLTTAIVSLADLLDDGELNGSINMEVLGIEEVERAQRDIEAIPGEKNVEVGFTVPEGAIGDFVANVIGTEPAVVPVDADTGPAEASVADLQNLPPIDLPVRLDLSGLGGRAAGGAVSAAQAALGQAGTGVTVTVDAVDNASPIIGDVVSFLASVDGYTATTVIDATDNASLTIGDVISFLSSVNGYTATTVIDATDNASRTIGDAVTFLSSVSGYTSTMTIAATDSASAVIGGAVTFLASVAGYTSTMSIAAVDNASGVIGDAVSFLSSVDGYTSTMTLNVVTNQITRYSSENARHGGIPGFASGGVLFEGGEAGPEVAHFAGGGTAVLPYHALYTAPTNTYISPANANEGRGALAQPEPIVVNNYGTIIGIDDLASSLEEALTQRRAGFGGAL